MGSVLSVIIIIILLFYAGYLLRNLILRSNLQIQSEALIRSLNEPFRPQDYDMDISLSMLTPIDPSVGFYTVRYIR